MFCTCFKEGGQREKAVVHCKKCKEDLCGNCYKLHIGLNDGKNHIFEWLNGKTEFVYEQEGSPTKRFIKIKIKAKPKPKLHDFTCKFCGSTYTQSGSLKKHIATIHEKKRLSCAECDRTFTQSSHLYR